MNKNIVVGILVIVALIGGVAVYSSHSQNVADQMAMQKETSEADAMKDKAMMGSTTDDRMMKKDGAMMKGAGTYETYAPSKLAMATVEHKVVLFFHASWCPTCRALDADIKAHLESIPSSLTILDVDYDTSGELKKKYGVTMQHTIVEVDTQGNLIKKWIGSPSLAALVAEVK
jgi:thioredoxin 1